MGHKHTKEDILAGALDAALDDGLSRLTFGRLAKRLGISDRIVVYYFPTKAELITEVFVALGAQLQAGLEPAFADPVADHRQLVRRAWPIVATSEQDRVFALFFEANGLATVGIEPYASLVPMLVTGWIAWAAALIEGDDEPDRHDEAAAAIALIDGLLLVRHLAGAEVADRAMATMIADG